MREVTGKDSMVILRKFMKLPAMYKDILLTASFVNGRFYENNEELFGLTLGRSICGYMNILPLNDLIHIYAGGNIADALLDVPKKALVTVKVQTVFAIVDKYIETYEADITVKEGEKGLLVREIINIQKELSNKSINKKPFVLLRDDKKNSDRGEQNDR